MQFGVSSIEILKGQTHQIMSYPGFLGAGSAHAGIHPLTKSIPRHDREKSTWIPVFTGMTCRNACTSYLHVIPPRPRGYPPADHIKPASSQGESAWIPVFTGMTCWNACTSHLYVIPANAGIHPLTTSKPHHVWEKSTWIPVFTGMTCSLR